MLLKKIHIVILGIVTMLVTAFTAVAQVPLASDVFVGAPRQITPLLDKSVKLDMVDYFNSGMATPSKNLLDGNARVTALHPGSISVQTSEAEKYTIAVLPVGKSFVIAVIQTLAIPEADSNIKFYDAKWRPLDGDRYMKAPAMADWLTSQGRKNRKAVDDAVPFVTAEYVKDGAVVIDVGINRVNGKLKGDVLFEEVEPKASVITPVPKGVGPMTVCMLLDNTLKAWKRHQEE